MPPIHPDHPPYIPIIKWQNAETKVLEAIEDDPGLVDRVWPCIEVRGVTHHDLLMSEVYHSWKGTVLVDYSDPTGRLSLHRMPVFESFLSVAGNKNYPIIPVIDSRDAAQLSSKMQQLLATFTSVVVRLRLDGLRVTQAQFDSTVAACKNLLLLGGSPRLMVDLGECPSTRLPRELEAFAAALRGLKELGFVTVHVASGAYPESLVDVTAMAECERHDWTLWKELNAMAPELLLGYSDYGILSPKWTEEILKKIAKKVVLRYTRDKDWLILKAAGKKKEDSINLSVILVTTYAADFRGADFSLGDRQMAIRADSKVPYREKKAGPLAHIVEAWIHHIAYVLKKQY
ncbi:TPA: hypothetical protein MXV02_005905 [Pseudomonas aeruginosa]|nr:hypothetical protein [Pseudomonas aeruginosa]HCA6450995.1 hypothetical protein [Pseudomonas aeruginosa]HCA6592106.1 hypothetical protein [Pseudomonas aeruginosa]HCA6620513.1 hypothetical protein [Pseudomonas aeruginosa]HCA6637714.1 hypothetical protein [Pseudomonas aeruginosa]